SGRARRCVLGSVKSNVGHLLTAAGGASLMKMLAAFENQMLPPTANFEQPAEALSRTDSPFQVLREARPWERRSGHEPRRAAINAFGFGGINAHVLLEECIDRVAARIAKPQASDTCGFAIRAENVPASPIAIIGLAAHFGPWDNLRRVQEQLFAGPSLNRQPAALNIPQINIPLGEFRIPPLELEDMLPQQQLMLQVSAAAIDDAGCPRELGDRTGVFVGISLDPNTTNFHCRWAIEEH